MSRNWTTRWAAIVVLALLWPVGPARAAEPLTGDPEYLAASAQFANGHYRQAIVRLADLLKRYPQHVRLQTLLADAYERSGQAAAARELYRAVLAARPDPRTEAIATEGVARLTRVVEQPAPATTAPADPFDLTAEQVAAMSVIYPEQARRKTEHFEIVANNPALADVLAQRAETVFERVRRTVLGGQMFPHRVELVVYADEAAFRKAQPGADWSGGGYLFIPQSDGTVRRVIALYQVDEQNRFRSALLTRELPHELAHVVLKEYFGQAPCPTWLDEGLASIAEADGGRGASARMADMLSRGLATPLAEMIDRIRPTIDRPVAFYTQSTSWTRFLRSNLSDAQMKELLAQIKGGQTPSVALGRVLFLDDRPGWLGAMEERWHKSVREKREP